MSTTTTFIQVTIEGKPLELEDREYTGTELRALGGIPERDKLVREEDGSETAILPTRRVRPHPGDNVFTTHRFRRG